MSEHYQPTALDLVSGVLRGGKVDQFGAKRQRNVRVSVVIDAAVENLAKDAGVSYQLMHDLMLEVGIDALEQRIGSEAFDRYRLLTQEQLSQADSKEEAA